MEWLGPGPNRLRNGGHGASLRSDPDDLRAGAMLARRAVLISLTYDRSRKQLSTKLIDAARSTTGQLLASHDIERLPRPPSKYADNEARKAGEREMTRVTEIELNDGTQIPQLGFGVFQIAPDETAVTVKAALDIGYRHIDTAHMYQTEKGVGEGVRNAGVDRAQVYITSKLNNGYQQPDEAKRAFDQSLAALGFDYVDFFLIHWPATHALRWRLRVDVENFERVQERWSRPQHRSVEFFRSSIFSGLPRRPRRFRR